jgi:hypothetical protein
MCFNAVVTKGHGIPNHRLGADREERPRDRKVGEPPLGLFAHDLLLVSDVLWMGIDNALDRQIYGTCP